MWFGSNLTLTIENMDFQSNLSMMESIDFEEKVDIDDLVLPSKPSKMGKMEILDHR